MAQLRSKRGNLIDCNILNESYDSYIVEIDGKVGPVKKTRIVSMNAIDEAVLDRIKSGWKKGLDWIKGVAYRLFVKNGIIRVFGKKGEQIPVSIPLNFGILAQGQNNLSYFPSDDDYKIMDELGLNIQFDPRVPSDKKGIGNDMSYADYAREFLGTVTEGDARAEAEDTTLYKRIQAHATGDAVIKGDPENAKKYIYDMEYNDLVTMITRRYEDLRKGIRQQDVICLWGPPGIGKTAMIDEVLYRLKKKGFTNVRSSSLGGNGRPDNSLYLPGREEQSYIGSNNKKYQKQVWAGNEMAGIPAFADNGMSPEDRTQADLYANGGRYKTSETGENICVARPDGGILFIDEFSRAQEDLMVEFMKIFSDAKFGTNIYLGSRWLVVLAANRKADMEGISTADRFRLDSAQQCRIESYNVVINPETWLTWAAREIPDRFYLDADKDYYTDEDIAKLPLTTNIIPEIREYIEGNKGALSDLAINPDDAPEFVNQHAPKTNGRAWHNVSKELKSLMHAASEDLGQPINTLVDLIASGYEGIRSINDLVTRIFAKLGTGPAEQFGHWFENKVVSKAECQRIWTTGKTTLSQTPLFTAKNFIIPRYVSFNPYAENAKNFMELLPPNAWLNTLKFIDYMVYKGTGQNSEQASYAENFRMLYSAFQNEMNKEYRSICGNRSISDNISLLDPKEQELYGPAMDKYLEIKDKYRLGEDY